MRRESASKFELLAQCGWWATPEAKHERLTAPEATFGTAIHNIAASAIDDTVQVIPLGMSDDEIAHLAQVSLVVLAYIQDHKRLGWKAEVAFAFDIATGKGRELPSKDGHRDYSDCKPTEIPGTADLVYMAHDAEGPFACVDDWKWSGFHGDDLRAEGQLSGLALMVSKAWGVDRVRARALRISDDGVDDTSEVYWLDVFELARIEADICAYAEAVANAKPNPGPWCSDRWCPAIADCPATKAVLPQLIPATALVRDYRLSTTLESPEHAAWTLAAVEMVDEATKIIRQKLRDYADANGGIPLADGKVWAGAEVVTEKVDITKPGAEEELRAMGLEKAFEPPNVTWASIKRVGGPKAEKMAREILSAIGATKESRHMRYEARSPKWRKKENAA